MTAPQRIQLRRAKGWRKPAGTIVVARPTRWGNPYRVVTHTERDCSGWAVLRPDRSVIACYPNDRAALAYRLAVELYRNRVVGAWRPQQRDAMRAELAGHELACWCPLDQPCHGDVLLKLANGPAS